MEKKLETQWKVIEVKPPWIVRPHFPPVHSFWQQSSCEDLGYYNVWAAYWDSMHSQEKEHYLVRWGVPNTWRAFLSAIIEQEPNLEKVYEKILGFRKQGSWEVMEIKPPWIVYPGHYPGESFWRNGSSGDSYLTYVWNPFVNLLDISKKREFRLRWKQPSEWVI